MRSDEFKNWFGDWENTNNSSKIIDENDFGGDNIKAVIYRENKEKSEILDELINEISRVRDVLSGIKKGPLRTNYLNKILNFHKELEMDGFDYKDQTK